METSVFLLQLVMILFLARFIGEVASQCRVPAVLGEILAGVLIGPSLLGWVEMNAMIALLAEIGIILLLFEVGLETDMTRLSFHGGKALIVALGGVIFPFFFGFFISYSLFSFSLLTSLFIGGTLTATSIGITLRVMRELGKQNTEEAQVILGAAIVDDVIGIILLAMLYEFAVGGSMDMVNAVSVLVFVALFFILAPLAAKGIFELIRKWEPKSTIPGLFPTILVSLILFFAWLAHALGVPALLGGFAAGIALSKKFSFPYLPFLKGNRKISERVEHEMKPIIHLFTPIFFIAIGLSLDLKGLNFEGSFIWGLIALLTGGALLGKFFAGFLIKETLYKKTVIGVSMIPRGEIGLIFASLGLGAGVFSSDVYTAVVLVIMITTLFAPLCLRWLYRKRRFF